MGESRAFAWLVALALATTLLELGFARASGLRFAGFLIDFRAFYCAGAAVDVGRDPYRAEPLRSCEIRAYGAFPRGYESVAVPAPLPGYALPPFMLLARLPYALAASLWLAASALALAASVWALARLSTLRPRIVWAALLLSVGLVSGFLGQLVPFALAALCFAALWIEEGRTWPAACAAAAACVEPHFGLPACLGLAVFFPRARPPLAALALGGALLAFATLGVAENLEYLERVLPAHLASEVANEEQYSLTHALALAGVPAAAALRLGSVAYGAAVVAAILLAAALLRRAAPPSLGVLLPAAFAPLGGAFVHVQQMAFALPAVLVLLGRVAPGDVLLGLALVLLALPLGDFTFLFLIAPAVAAAVFVLLREQLRATLPVACGTAALAVAASAALTFSYASRPDAHAAVAAVAGPDELAEATWGALIATSYHSNVVLFSISKLPSYAGLALLVIVTVRRAAYGRDDPARVEAEAPPCES